MKHISRKNYRTDKYYERIVRAVDSIVDRQGFVAPINVFLELGLLEKNAMVEWRTGRLPFLERAIHCNLACASRILRILRFHVARFEPAPFADLLCAQDALRANAPSFHKDGRTFT